MSLGPHTDRVQSSFYAAHVAESDIRRKTASKSSNHVRIGVESCSVSEDLKLSVFHDGDLAR